MGSTELSRDSSVGIATSYGPGRDRDFYLLYIFQTGCGAHSLSYPVGPGGEADQLPLSGAEFKKGGVIPSLPHTSSWRGI
jgi:hypothetical protein